MAFPSLMIFKSGLVSLVCSYSGVSLFENGPPYQSLSWVKVESGELRSKKNQKTIISYWINSCKRKERELKKYKYMIKLISLHISFWIFCLLLIFNLQKCLKSNFTFRETFLTFPFIYVSINSTDILSHVQHAKRQSKKRLYLPSWCFSS